MNLEEMIAQIRAALGLAENGDPVVAIANMQTQIAELRASLAADPERADTAEVAALRAQLRDAQTRYLTAEADANRRIAAIETRMLDAEAEARVDRLIDNGRIRPVARDVALNVARTSTEEQWSDFVAMLPSVDLRERGVATGADLAELEPNETDIKVARDLGLWDDADPAKSKIELMRAKAARRGKVLPADFDGGAA